MAAYRFPNNPGEVFRAINEHLNILKTKDKRFAQAAYAKVSEVMGQLNGVQLCYTALAVSRIPHIPEQRHQVLNEIRSAVLPEISKFSADQCRPLVVLAVALSTLPHECVDVWGELYKIVDQDPYNFDVHDQVRLLVSAGKSAEHDSSRFQIVRRLLPFVAEGTREFSGREMANILQTLGKLNLRIPPPFWEQVLRTKNEWTQIDVIQIMVAVSKLGLQTELERQVYEKVMEFLEKEADNNWNTKSFSPQHCTNILSAIFFTCDFPGVLSANLSRSHEVLLNRISDQFLGDTDGWTAKFKPKEFSNFFASLAKLADMYGILPKAKEVASKLEQLDPNLSKFNARDLVYLLKSFAILLPQSAYVKTIESTLQVWMAHSHLKQTDKVQLLRTLTRYEHDPALLEVLLTSFNSFDHFTVRERLQGLYAISQLNSSELSMQVMQVLLTGFYPLIKDLPISELSSDSFRSDFLAFFNFCAHFSAKGRLPSDFPEMVGFAEAYVQDRLLANQDVTTYLQMIQKMAELSSYSEAVNPHFWLNLLKDWVNLPSADPKGAFYVPSILACFNRPNQKVLDRAVKITDDPSALICEFAKPKYLSFPLLLKFSQNLPAINCSASAESGLALWSSLNRLDAGVSMPWELIHQIRAWLPQNLKSEIMFLFNLSLKPDVRADFGSLVESLAVH